MLIEQEMSKTPTTREQSGRKVRNEMDSVKVYDNPLIGRYASREMAALWSPQHKHSTWRRMWVALAEAQHELGLVGDDGKTPRISPAQLDEMRAHIADIDFDRAAVYEEQKRHDVFAHIETYGDAAPSARGIIHLGTTSCDVTDNADLIILRDALTLIRRQVVGVIDALGRFALKYKSLATVGFTHFQPAQLTTVGKRATLWCNDFLLDLTEIEHRFDTLAFRGVKGATGTQASFLELFRGDASKVDVLERLVAKKMGFERIIPVSGQTYSRKVDSQILDVLSGVAQSVHKMATDLRLLAHRQEVDEPTEKGQVGSSAMPYKRNPMRCERMCGLARFVSSLTANGAQTASTQWLERSLDDSVNRRLTLPQAFLATDAILRLALNVTEGLEVFPHIIGHNVAEVLPYMATENLLMAAVTTGADRQKAHERIRELSRAVTKAVREGTGTNNLLDLLRREPMFAKVDFDSVLSASDFVGRAPEQTVRFVAEHVEPVRRRYPDDLGQKVQLSV
jgi:adenylosuccinate lyase